MNTLLKIVWNSIFNISGLDISFSARYSDWSFYLIELKARYQAVKEFLAERRIIPKEIAPGETGLQIVGCEMRKVQVAGPYNEVSIQVPVEPLEDSPNAKFTHLYLPVNTEKSRWPGVDIMGFPKFLANIEIMLENNRILCRLAAEGQLILEFKMDHRTGPRAHYRWDYYGVRKGRIVKTTMDPEGFISEEQSGGNASLMLGDHKVADTLREILISDEIVRTVIGHNVSSTLKKPVRIETK
jgi:hypothetical protein